jgi:hypothetical protein
MGGKSAAPQNNQMVEFEREQAAEARRKEDERKGRLETGRTQIDRIFGGDPIMETKKKKFDLTNLTPQTGTPFALESIPSSEYNTTHKGKYKVADSDYTYEPFTAGGYTGGDAYALYNPGGGFAKAGRWGDIANELQGKEYDAMAPSGKYKEGTEPFGKDFYDTYRNAYTSFQNKQAERQYLDAERERQFGFARAGTIGSTPFATTKGKLDTNFLEAGAEIASRGEQAVTDKQKEIEGQKTTALNQLIQTEDPERAAAQALGMVNQQQLSKPPEMLLGDLFKPLVIGAGGAYNTYQDNMNYNRGRNATGRGVGSWTDTPSS